MVVHRPPHPRLAPFVQSIWASDAEPSRPGVVEHVLPTGTMHLVFRLAGSPLRLCRDAAAGQWEILGWAVVGGARSGYYAKDVSAAPGSVGAQLRPGASGLLFGVDAAALAEQHTPLEALWAAGAGLALERIHAAVGNEARLAVLEKLLAERLPVVRALHPAVAQALHRWGHAPAVPVAELVQQSGYSHRRFADLFRQGVGLGPKTFARVQRFQAVLRRAHAGAAVGLSPPWAELALDAGYSDQAHLSREFSAFAGVAPEVYRRARPVEANHLRIR